jgi:hypothetical protein
MHTGPLPHAATARRVRRPIAAWVVGVVVAAFVTIPAMARADTATLSTDQSVYYPGQTVHFSGSGFAASTTYALPVLRPDGSIVTGDGTGTPGWDQVTTDASGNLAYDYLLAGMDGTYEGRVYDSSWSGDTSASPTASVTFTDPNPAANLDQCRNGPFASPSPCDGTDLSPFGWVNGDANGTQAHFREGDSIPYRIRFTNLDTTTSHKETIQWDTTKGGKHALDYLTSFDRTVTTADPCAGVSGCGSPTTFPIPLDPNVTVPQIAGHFTCYNCTITGVGSPPPNNLYSLSGSYAGDSSTSITIEFTTTVANPVLAWGGHIASQFDWGSGNSAISISGSPYHTRTLDLDGKGGNQDRALAAAAVLGPPGMTTQVSATQAISPGDSVTDTASVTHTDSNGPVNGTVTFFECFDASAVPDCTTGGSQVGATKTVTITNSPSTGDGSATSDPFTPGTDPSANGYYCFRAEYTPDVTAKYSIGKETNQLLPPATGAECFQQVPVTMQVIKQFSGGEGVNSQGQVYYFVGDTIHLTISVTNTGQGTAKNVVLTDPFADPILNWAIDTTQTNDAGCSITSSVLTCLWGDMGPGTTKTVHITATATADGVMCGTNRATVTTDNAGSAIGEDHLMIYGSDVTVQKVATPPTISAGDVAAFNLKVGDSSKNDVSAQDDAKNVTLTDTLPAGVIWSVNDTTHCSVSSNTLSCSFGTILKDTYLNIRVSGKTTAANCGPLQNTATVADSNEGPTVKKNDTSKATITVLCPDVHVSVTPDASPVNQPGQIGFVIQATNNGAGKAYGVVVTETLPTNSGLHWSIDYAGSNSTCAIAAGVLTCKFGTLASGASKHVHIVSATTGATVGTVTSNASVSATNEAAADQSDNTGSGSVTVN